MLAIYKDYLFSIDKGCDVCQEPATKPLSISILQSYQHRCLFLIRHTACRWIKFRNYVVGDMRFLR
jgi:hypothetical protein